jgi:hypothetical protein
MRLIGRNMAWLLNAIKKEELPKSEDKIKTNFIK